MQNFSSICQSMFEKSVENWRTETRTDGRRVGRTETRTDRHQHTIILPVWRRAYKKGWSRAGAWTGTLKNPTCTKCLRRWEPDRRSNILLQSACTSMCRHIHDWNIVDCDVKQPIQLKYIFISREIAYIQCNIITRIVPCKHSNNTRMSDLRCIKLTLDTCGNKGALGYWKLNTSLLQNTDFVNAINIHLKIIIFNYLDPHHS